MSVHELTDTFDESQAYIREDLTEALIRATDDLYAGDRRLHCRRKFAGSKMLVRKYDGIQGLWEEVFPDDFSRGGTLINTDKKFSRGTRLWISIRPDKSLTHLEPFLIAGEVRHVTQIGDKHRTGIQFRPELVKDLRRFHTERALESFEQFLAVIEGASK